MWRGREEKVEGRERRETDGGKRKERRVKSLTPIGPQDSYSINSPSLHSVASFVVFRAQLQLQLTFS